MYSEFDVYAYLVSHNDVAFFEGHEEEAVDQLNEMLHYIADFANENDNLEILEEVVRQTLFDWIENPELLELDSEEMQAYINERLEDARQQDNEEDDY